MIRKTWKKIGIHKNKRATYVLEDLVPIPETQYTNIFMFGNVPAIAWNHCAKILSILFLPASCLSTVVVNVELYYHLSIYLEILFYGVQGFVILA